MSLYIIECAGHRNKTPLFDACHCIVTQTLHI